MSEAITAPMVQTGVQLTPEQLEVAAAAMYRALKTLDHLMLLSYGVARNTAYWGDTPWSELMDGHFVGMVKDAIALAEGRAGV